MTDNKSYVPVGPVVIGQSVDNRAAVVSYLRGLADAVEAGHADVSIWWPAGGPFLPLPPEAIVPATLHVRPAAAPYAPPLPRGPR